MESENGFWNWISVPNYVPYKHIHLGGREEEKKEGWKSSGNYVRKYL